MVRRISEKLIEAMAERITGVNTESYVYFEELIGCEASAKEVGIDSAVGFLIDAARCPFNDTDGVMKHEFDARYTAALRRNPLLAPIIAQALACPAGVTKDERDDGSRRDRRLYGGDRVGECPR